MPDLRVSRIVPASDLDLDAVRDLWTEYWDSLGFPLDFQGFAGERRSLPGLYAPPGGRLLLALIQDQPAGTAALRPLSAHSCEGKRLYVRPLYRRMGIGRNLVDRLVAEARLAGYREMYGDTLKSMRSAFELYTRVGFREVGPYSPNPTPGAIFLKLSL